MPEQKCGTDVEVIDDLLAPEEFSALWRRVQRLRYEQSGGEWNKVWSLADPMPAVSQMFTLDDQSLPGELRHVLETIRDRMRVSPLFDAAWRDLHARVYLQPRGSRLAAHGDSRYAGSAAFYAHPTWSPAWGGELLVPQMPRPDEWGTPGPLDGPIEDERMNANEARFGGGYYVAARPNRLVLIRRGVWHRTLRVDPDAGSHLRCAIAAFAVSP